MIRQRKMVDHLKVDDVQKALMLTNDFEGGIEFPCITYIYFLNTLTLDNEGLC